MKIKAGKWLICFRSLLLEVWSPLSSSLPAYPGCLLKIQTPNPFLSLLNHNWHFNRIPWWFVCTLKILKQPFLVTSAVFLKYPLSHNAEKVTDLLGIKNASDNYMYLIPKGSLLFNEETPAKVRNKTKMDNIIIII